MAAGVVVGPQRERADLARAVARLALLLDDPRDVGGERHRADLDRILGLLLLQGGHDLRGRRPDPRPALRLGPADHGPGLGPVQQATGDRRGGRLDLLAGQDRVERLAQIGMRGGRLACPPGVLVVDRPPVADLGAAVEHEDLARALHQGQVGHEVARVLQDGEVDPVLPGMGGHLLDGLMGIGVDRQEDDAPVLVRLVKLHQPRRVEVADRAIGPREGQDDGPLAAESVERDRGPLGVLEGEVGHALADRAGDRRRLGRADRPGGEGHQGRDQEPSACIANGHPLHPSPSRFEYSAVRGDPDRGPDTDPSYDTHEPGRRFRENAARCRERERAGGRAMIACQALWPKPISGGKLNSDAIGDRRRVAGADS